MCSITSRVSQWSIRASRLWPEGAPPTIICYRRRDCLRRKSCVVCGYLPRRSKIHAPEDSEVTSGRLSSPPDARYARFFFFLFYINVRIHIPRRKFVFFPKTCTRKKKKILYLVIAFENYNT